MINMSTRIKPCFKAEFSITYNFLEGSRHSLSRGVDQVYAGVKTGPKYLRDLQKTIPIWYKNSRPSMYSCLRLYFVSQKKIKRLTAQYLVKCSKIRKLIWHLIVILQKLNKVFQRKKAKVNDWDKSTWISKSCSYIHTELPFQENYPF